VADPSGYIFTWLVGYSSLLGPVGGIMIADYYFIRKQQLQVNDLYINKGRYGFSNGYNTRAILALLLGIAPNVPGFLVTIKLIAADAVPAWISQLYHYAWFVGFFASGLIYMLLMRTKKKFEPVDRSYVVVD
jgi:NCS1 family nucleobase:cation symporter-1